MSKRRANGEGNIRKRPDGRWERWYIAGHDENGKAIRKNVLGSTQAEVKERPKKAIRKCAEIDTARADENMVGKLNPKRFKLHVVVSQESLFAISLSILFTNS